MATEKEVSNTTVALEIDKKAMSKELPDITSPFDDALMKRKRTRGKISPIGFELPQDTEETEAHGPVYQEIQQLILGSLKPYHIELIDDSASHAGHEGAAGYSGESHFKLHVVSESFDGLNRVKRHQLVYSTLGDLMKTKIHALNIKAQTVVEFTKE
mmetsp:Transcript_24605/g.32029  ORF Transcript_24605/g.32029 Transcript_24605/m.32029 type:complete len:157 (-) Transcript_24605:137-607(-)